MSWLLLVIAGLLEVVFTTVLRFVARPGSHWGWEVAFVCSVIASFAMLQRVIQPGPDGQPAIPLGTAYAVWTAIGAAGTVVVGAVLFGEKLDGVRAALLLAIVGATVGLKLTGH